MSSLGDRIDSNLFHASNYAPGRFEEWDELHLDDMKNAMNCTRIECIKNRIN